MELARITINTENMEGVGKLQSRDNRGGFGGQRGGTFSSFVFGNILFSGQIVVNKVDALVKVGLLVYEGYHHCCVGAIIPAYQSGSSQLRCGHWWDTQLQLFF